VADENNQNRTETGQHRTVKVTRLPKTHQDYWQSRLKKRSYESGGKTIEISTWQVRLTHLGREGWFNLDTANKTAAAAKARDIYLHLITHGWTETNTKYKPGLEVAKDGCNVGEFLAQVKAVSGLKPVTFEIYAKKFRSLVAGVFKLHGGKGKFDYVNGGRKSWLARVHAVRLDKLTPDKVNAWRVSYLKAASGNPLKHKHAHITANSILRAGKSLFSPKILKLLSLRLPQPLPFEGVENPKVPKSRYQSEINPALLLQQARRELAEAEGDDAPDKREMFKIIVLALGAGLRRDEIDTLQWRHVLWQRNLIRVETTEHGGTKSAESQADVDVDPALLALLKEYLPTPGKGSPFVIQSAIRPQPNAASYHHYRCDRLFGKVIEWLRSKGITARNALHSLRKEFGSQVCAQGGIYAASLALRHASIQVTCDFYTDKRKAVVFPMAEMLKDKPEALPSPKAA
jgi:integrase